MVRQMRGGSFHLPDHTRYRKGWWDREYCMEVVLGAIKRMHEDSVPVSDRVDRANRNLPRLEFQQNNLKAFPIADERQFVFGQQVE